MNVYTNNSFEGHYPVGAAAVVVAKDARHAAQQLEIELRRIGLIQYVDPDDMLILPRDSAYVRILDDGNY